MAKKQKDPRPCFEVTLHFHDRGFAQAAYDAASLDDDLMWKVTMKQGAD